MSDARDDIRNLFHSHGLAGGYREFGERPAAPRPAAPRASESEPVDSERKPPRLGLVRSAPERPRKEQHPLQRLFEQLAAEGAHRAPATHTRDGAAADLMHIPLADLFEHLGSQGTRPLPLAELFEYLESQGART